MEIVQREFYPPEMSNERYAKYNNGQLPRPMDVLEETMKESAESRLKIAVGKSVVHWFKRDLRTVDNRALSLASKKAKEKNVPLICLFIVSPQDYQAHLTSAPRVDFELRTLEILKADLAERDIPLFVTTFEDRNTIPARILELCQELGAHHVFCNIEYEVDELRREDKLTKMCLEAGIDFTAVHDDVIVTPGALYSGAGQQYSVYSPWYRAWVAHIHKHRELLDECQAPTQNPSTAREKYKALFDQPMPPTPDNKKLTADEKARFTSLWPAGEHEAHARLQKFVSQRISKYNDLRSFPAANNTGVLSVHFSVGTLAARSAVRTALACNSSPHLDAGNTGIKTWISEVAWRDFYKHVLAHWPHVCMHKPFKYEYSQIRWERNASHFRKWCQGQTGFPIVDAAMRQLKHMGYMHNRCRMIVASFLAKDLLLDWRLGERFFMESLIDGDFASNSGGWGFSASCGVDPQPYFRIFNPLLQSEKFDADGEYIRKWVPELRGVRDKAVHDPYGMGEGRAAEKAGYPRPVVVHRESRERCLARYKEGIGRTTA
ncbi:putative Deoxyribodipyrimidine photo-lyase [Delphinella strobiligena]|nr:putative Deoxyribodipyrimidine photo-lyase [Delphinella strobiligena]